MEKIRVFTAFAGYDSQCMALDMIKEQFPTFDYELVGWSEIDKNAIMAHNAVYPQWADRNAGDITKIDWGEQPDFDLFTYSFPCFCAGTLVLTQSGLKHIEEVNIGDNVVTHNNRYRQVINTMKRTYGGQMYIINAMPVDEIKCTPEHPFFVRIRRRVWNNSIRKSVRIFDDAKWCPAKDLTKDTYIGVPVNQTSAFPEWKGTIDNRYGHGRCVNKLRRLFEKETFWYLMGRYVGDGWKKTSDAGSGIIICCGGRHRNLLTTAMDTCGFAYTTTKERTVEKFTICSKELYEFVDRYGYYAYGKKIDIETINLPSNLLKSFLDGYEDSDGYINGKYHKISSVSRDLIYGAAQCVSKVYHSPYRIYRTKRKRTTVIEGRIVNQRDSYELVWKTEPNKQDKAFYDSGYIWYPINNIKTEESVCDVYNLEVSEDNSYTANCVIVHNCTDISSAGLQKGLSADSGTRSSLLWECEKAIRIKRPKYLLMENVSALVTQKFIGEYHKWLNILEGYGYSNFGKVMNAKDYGIPQNRERIFLVSILGEETFCFPKEIPLELRLKDLLEDEVDDKYVLSDKIIDGFLEHNRKHKEKGTGFIFVPKDVESDGGGSRIANCLRAKAALAPTDNVIKERKYENR